MATNNTSAKTAKSLYEAMPARKREEQTLRGTFYYSSKADAVEPVVKSPELPWKGIAPSVVAFFVAHLEQHGNLDALWDAAHDAVDKSKQINGNEEFLAKARASWEATQKGKGKTKKATTQKEVEAELGL